MPERQNTLNALESGAQGCQELDCLGCRWEGIGKCYLGPMTPADRTPDGRSMVTAAQRCAAFQERNHVCEPCYTGWER